MARALVAYRPGDVLPELEFPPLTRHMFALYCGGSGDHNPLHTDIDFARDAGRLPDVIGQGMLSMALAGRFLTNLTSPQTLSSFAVRFVSMTRVRDVLTCAGAVDGRSESHDRVRLSLAIRMSAADGRTILTGRAVVGLARGAVE
jgi:acyl dehydratase